MRYFLSGLLCFGAAIYFGFQPRLNLYPGGGYDDQFVANVTSAGASLGFAVAGGLCMVAASLSGQKSKE